MNNNLVVKFGPFAQTRKNIDEFCHSLVLSHAMNECIERLIAVEKEYNEAVLRDDVETVRQKKLEMQSYQSSLQFTAYMLDESQPVGF
tara:strand:+ start:623 stop:886 length:264 start_codon:yes stop_codon:yes gene_type:complete